MLRTGSVIDGKYKILSEIGRGGMSTVYLAINERANKPWAVKEVRKICNKDCEVLRQSLIAETELLKRLRHPNLPSIADVIDHDGSFLIVMDYIEGNTLEKHISETGAQTQEDVVSWALQLCSVLEYLHSRPIPIIYRDMKPSNIMLRSDGSVVLIDFGTAREFKERNVADTVCLGTQGYAAPEQFGGMGQTDARTDIYCLGATMYHLLTGHNPSRPPYEMYPITEWDSGLSSGLEQIILRCTQKNPDERYPDVRALRCALERYHDFEAQAQRRYRGRLRLFLATAGLSVLCAAAGSGL
ncbi:MAG: serine/threonine protein kinase, partial [Roseburia sp.]|nr:serine/threonine protein kinase [Roseburia sp.]